MQKQIERPVRRAEQQSTDHDKERVWPLSAREFMKLPVSGLLSAERRIRFTRLAPPDRAA